LGPAGEAQVRRWWNAVPAAVLGLAVVLATSLALHLFWLIRFRHSSLTEWDEAGYIQIGVLDRAGFAHDGLVGLARSVLHQPGEAPLVPLLAVPVYLVAGTGVFQSLFVLPLFFVVLVLATWGLARKLTTPGWSLVAALVVAGMPAVIDYTRLFHFTLAASTFATLALWALLSSEGLNRRSWAVAAGVFVALTLLSRTMTLAYLPGFALAAGAQLVRRGDRMRPRLLNLALGAAAAVGVAAVWYAPNAGSVHAYLVGAGYGASSGSFGTKHPVLSVGFWSKELRLVVQQLYGPLALVLALCLVAGAVAAWQTGAYRRLRSPVSLAFTSLLVFVLEGYLALTSSTNEGTAFALPWLPALVVVAVAGAARVRPAALRPALGVLLVAVSLFGIAMKSGLVRPIARPHAVTMAVLGRVPLTDGRGIIQEEVEGAGYPIGNPTEPLPSFHRRWLSVADSVTTVVLARAAHARIAPDLIVAMDDGLLNNTRFRLAAALSTGRYLPVGRLAPAGAHDAAAAYEAQLRGSHASALVTAPPTPGAKRTLTLGKVAEGARAAGFRPLQSFHLPDGRLLELWWKRNPSAPQGTRQ
jgi:hypothetical protein